MIKNILVQLKVHEEWSPHLDYAFNIAAGFKARLVGIAIFEDIAAMQTHLPFNRGRARDMFEKAFRQQYRDNKRIVAELKKRWNLAARKYKICHEFVTAGGRTVELLPWAARFYDLTIAELPNRGKDEQGYEVSTALAAGRPLILVPESNDLVPVPRTLLLAWNSSPEAAAALHGSLPFLQAAEEIVVLDGERKKYESFEKAIPEINLMTTLKQHLGKVSIEQSEISDADIGHVILERAQTHKAHLIIMGAYGRPRISEILLGGATHHVFRHTTIPILTSH